MACRLRMAACVCALAPRQPIATRVVLFLHRSEWGRIANTGHLLRLALSHVEIRLHGMRHRPVATDGIEASSPTTMVLFPDRSAQPLTAPFLASMARPATLLVPDGNWNQAKAMARRIPLLAQARTVRLDQPRLSLGPLRRNLAMERRSTFEAIAQALGLLEGGEVERTLLDFFQRFLAAKGA